MNSNSFFRNNRFLFLLLVLAFAAFFTQSCASAVSDKKGAVNGTVEEIEPRSYPTMAIQKFNLAELYRQNGEYARAVLEYEDAARFDSSSATIFTRLAESYLKIHKYREALDSYDKVLKLESWDSNTANTIAQLHLLLGEVEEAEQMWLRITRQNPDERDAWFHLHEYYTRAEQNKKAEENLKNFLKHEPGDKEALQDIIDLLKDQKRYDEGIPYAKMLVSEYPEEGALQYSLIQLYLLMENDKKALEAIREWVKASRDKLESRLFLANFYISRDRYEDALEILKKLAPRWQENWWIPHLSAMAYEHLGHSDSIRANYQRAVGFENSGILPFEAYAFWAIDNGYFEEAANVALEGLKRDSTNIRLRLIRANSFSELGSFGAAIAEYEILHQQQPKDPGITHQLALLHDSQKNHKRSDTLYRALLSADSNDHLALNNWAYSLSERGKDLERALEMVEKAISLQPENGAYYDTKAWILFKSGRHSEALEVMDITIEKVDISAEIYYHKAEILAALKRREEALEYLNMALELDPDYDLAVKFLEEIRQ